MKPKTLDVLLIQEVQKVVQSKQFLVKLVAYQFEKAGLKLTSDQLKGVENQLDFSAKENIKIEFSDDQASALAQNGIDLKQLDLGELTDESFQQELSRVTREVMNNVVERSASNLAVEWSKARRDVLKDRNKRLGDFHALVRNIWGTALDALQGFITLCVELEEHQFANGLANVQNAKRAVLIRLHARSCQVANEICVLLRHGFADGAHARWRTLYELATIGEFLLDGPDELSEMYAVHADVERANQAEEFQRRQIAFGYERISDTDMAQIMAAKETARLKFGKEFLGDYGWATAYLRTRYGKQNDRTAFVNFEEIVNKSKLRNYYKLANRNVHAGFSGEASRLGNDPKWTGNVLLTGPSHFGLGIPAHNAAYSVGWLVTRLLLHDGTLENVIVAKALTRIFMQLNDLINAAEAKTEQD